MSERDILVELIEKGKEAEKKLAELDKPKIREFDYGIVFVKEGGFDRISSFIVIGNEIKFNTGSHNPIEEYPEGPYYEYLRLGNIFDDIKELSKPLKEFTMPYTSGTKSIEVSLNEHGDISLCVETANKCNIRSFTADQFDDFIMRCRRVAITSKER